MKEKNGTKHKQKLDSDKTAAQQANTTFENSRPIEKMYKCKFDNEADCESISNGSAIQTLKRQRKSDSDKELADAAHNTNQIKSSQQNNDNNEVSDCDPDDILDRMVEPKKSANENETNLSVLDDIEQEFELDNEVGPPINDQLTKVLKTMTKGKMDENKIQEKCEKHKRPSSVEQPVVPKVNPEIWGILDHNTKSADLNLQRKQKMLIKAVSALAYSCDMHRERITRDEKPCQISV